MHTQNMKTFEGWGVVCNNVVILSQNYSDKYMESSHKNINGYLMPFIKNKYLNILYFTLNGLRLIIRLNHKYKFDLIQASDAGGAILALIVSKLYKKKFLFEVQGDIFDFPDDSLGVIRSRIVKYTSKIIAKRADYIRIISPFLYEPLDKFGIDRKKIFIVPPRCDSVLFNKLRVVNEYYPNIDKTKINILFVGNLTKAKGIDILIDAFSLVLKSLDNINLIIIGSGEEENNLKQQAKKLNIEDNVKFLGRVLNNEIPIVMNSVHIFVLPSIEEGMGRVLLESMAMQLPIIASNVGGIPLLIEHNKDGLLFEVGDTKQLSKHINSLINDNDLRDNLTINANKKFLENYEYEISMTMFIDMYKEIFNNEIT
jgi:L-malate glycosyltransferase